MGVQGQDAGDAGVPPLRRRAFWGRAAAALARQWGFWLVGLLLLTVPPFVADRRPAPRPPAAELPPAPFAVPPDDPVAPPPAPLPPALRELETADAAAALDFFRRNTLSTQKREQVRAVVARLSDESYREREWASAELRAFGLPAGGELRRAAASGDAETAKRARDLIDRELGGPRGVGVLKDGLRKVTRSPPAGAAAVLLDYLPDAPHEDVIDAVRDALFALTTRGGDVDAAVVSALQSPSAEARAAAAFALCQPGCETQREAVRGLLKDDVSEVRFRAAVGLLLLREREAVAPLVELLTTLPAREAWLAVDLLSLAAGPHAPTVPVLQGAAGRVTLRAAWRAWWEKQENLVELAAAGLPPPGLPPGRERTLLVVEVFGRRAHRRGVALVVKGETDVDTLRLPGLPRDEARGFAFEEPLAGLLCVQALPKGRYLYVVRGAVLEAADGDRAPAWSLERADLVYAERLADRKTFVVCRDAVEVIDAAGKVLTRTEWPLRQLATARRHADGRVAALTDEGTCVWLDPDGKELSRFELGFAVHVGAGFDLLPNGRLVVPDYAGGRVVEVGPAGELLWQCAAREPTSAERLPDGRTLAACERDQVLELDRGGRVVWRCGERGVVGRVHTATRR